MIPLYTETMVLSILWTILVCPIAFLVQITLGVTFLRWLMKSGWLGDYGRGTSRERPFALFPDVG